MDMNKQQEFLLSLGAEINEICARHNITYFLAHGSLIGAVRHGGIIPWDDDFDIFMPYEDWLRFKAVCQDSANLPPNRVLCCPDVQESYLHVMPRYVACDTTCIHKNQSLHEDYAGQVIDIFILDPVADDQFEAYQKDLFLYYEMLIYSDSVGARVGITSDEYLKLWNYREERGKLAACKLCEERLKSHFDPNGRYYAHRWHGSATVFRREDFSAQRFMSVGPYMLPVPSGFNGVMRSSYGDEWPTMPKNASAAKHNAPSSLKIPYKDALEYFRPTHNAQELLARMRARKSQILSRGDDKHFLLDNWARLRGTVFSLELERRLAGHDEEFTRAIEQRDGATLNRLLGDYVDRQIDRTILGRRFAALFWRYQHPVFIEVSDEIFEALVLALMCTERIGRAAQVLEVREEKFKLLLTPFMYQLQEDIRMFREGTDAMCAGQAERALRIAQVLRVNYPVAISFWRLETVALDTLRKAGHTDLLAQEEQLLKDALEHYPNDGYFMFYQLECRAARGEDVAADYPVAAELTVNGMVLSEIQRRYGYAPTWLRNKRWAKANGVPQWEGPEPQVPQDAVPPHHAAMCQSQRLCLDLLNELARICDELGLSYVCSPNLAKALFVNKRMPANLRDYTLYMQPKDALALARELRKRAPENRVLSGMGFDDLNPVTLFYGATGTTALTMRKPLAQQRGCLGVCVHALVSSGLPEGLSRVLCQYSCAAQSGATFTPEGKKARAYSLLHGIKGVSQTSAVKLASALSAKPFDVSGSSYCLVGSRKTPVPAIDFAASVPMSFEDIELRVPRDLKAYCAKSDVETASSFNADERVVTSASVSSEELLAACKLPEGYDERIAWYRERGAEDAVANHAFIENYEQLHLAVKLKALSLKLLPKKGAIVKMHQAGDTEGLNKVLKAYKSCYKKHADVGEVFLDPQIDEALKFIL